MTEIELRNKICAMARAWLGRKEADGSHRDIIDVYNAGRPAGSYKMTYTDPWCAAFVSAVGMAAGLEDIVLPHVNCDGMIAAYKAKGCWIEDDGYLPQPGDLIFYDWQDSGVGDNTGSADHVGIVVEVRGKLLTVIEGNYSDSVKQRYIYEDGKFTRGYAVPDYAGKAGEADRAAESVGPYDSQDDSEPEVVTKPGETAAPDGAALCRALPELRYGCCGLHVVVMQGILIARGYACGPDGADGDFGYNTRNALQNFQRGAGIDADGVCGPMTWSKLLGV